MKKFKQYLKEAPFYNDVDKEKDLTPYKEEPKKPTREYISNIGNHKVSRYYHRNSPGVHFALHEPNDHISLGVYGNITRDNKFYVDNMNGFGNKLPAHEFIHHLVTNHGIHWHSDYALSKGAFKVYDRLKSMPDIHMQVYDMAKREYQDIPPNTNLDTYMNKSSRFSVKKKEEITESLALWKHLKPEKYGNITEATKKTKQKSKLLIGTKQILSRKVVYSDKYRTIKYKKTTKEKEGEYTVHLPNEESIRSWVIGEHGPRKTFMIKSSGSTVGSNMSNADFYHHLTTKQKLHLHSGSLSPQEIKTWDELRRKPNIIVDGYDGRTNKYFSISNKDPIEKHLGHKEIRLAARYVS